MSLGGVFRSIGGEARLRVRRVRGDVHGERDIRGVGLLVGRVDMHRAVGTTRGHSALHVVKRMVSERQCGILWIAAEV